MTVQEQQGSGTKGIGAEDVAEYLNKHADFFDKHPEVLKQIEVPHSAGNAVSLIERQVLVLREENRNLRGRIRDLVDIAKDNDDLMTRMIRLSTDLVSSENLGRSLRVLNDRLTHDFGADGVTVRLIGDFVGNPADSRMEIVSVSHDALPLFESVLARGKPVCGRFSRQQLSFMFAGREDEMASVAVIPLGDGSLGFVAIGSKDLERFRAGISTNFLSYLGEIAGAVIKRFR